MPEGLGLAICIKTGLSDKNRKDYKKITKTFIMAVTDIF